MKIIYIRHGKKLYSNFSKHKQAGRFQHDSPLSPEGEAQLKDTFIMLENEGVPDLILCSPYERARQTMNCLFSHLSFENQTAKKVIDPKLSEFLGNQVFTDVSEETKKHKPPKHGETEEELEIRVKEHCLEIERNKENKVIWVISHGYTIQKIIEYWTFCDNFYPHEGEFMIIESKAV